MSVDLTTAPDHPVRVLADWLDGLPPTHHERPGGYRCQEVLSAHEREKGVTFAALSNDALQRIREAWDGLGELADAADPDDPETVQANDARVDAHYRSEILAAVKDLLGLDD
jgi:hypothetical protein